MEGIIKPYFYAACGAVGFALSFIVGLFSGAGFALILIRALAFAVFFGLLSCCLHLVLKRFVPDLLEEDFSLPKVERPSSASNSSASNIDITIEDDDYPIPDFLQEIVEGGEEQTQAASVEESSVASVEESKQDEQAKPLDKEEVADVSLNMGSVDEDEALDVLPDMPEARGHDSMSYHVDDSVFSTSLDTSELFDDVGGETMARAIRTVLSKE